MGVDVGTTGVKAVVFDGSGSIVASAYEEYPLLFPFAGASELDTRGVVEAARRMIAKAAAEAAGSDPVTAIGIASQGEAFAPIGDDGRVLCNAMTSSDSRAASLIAEWVNNFGQERVYHITGHTPYPMYTLFKMLWLRKNEPELWERAWKFLFMEDLVAFGLTGAIVTDYTMAARSMLFDVTEKRWSAEILGSLGLAEDRLPEVVPPGGNAVPVCAEMAERLGLGADVTVSVCGHDQPVGALGCGAASWGSAAYSIGTVECICPATGQRILGPELMKSNLATYPHVVDDTYTTVAFNITGGSVLKWVRDNIAIEESSQARMAGEDPYERIVAAASTEPANLVLLPHFGPTGTPHFDPTGTGVLFGLSLSTSRAEILRAVLEGITYEMRLNLSILAESGFELSELRAVGGGAKSPVWMQIKADILGVPLTTMRVTEATCMGAAILAGSGRGMFDALETSRDWAAAIRTFEPRKEYAPAYEDRFEVYKELYDALGSARRRLHALRGNRG